jgi:hypothetical protein
MFYRYYVEVIGSRANGGLNLAVNLKMLNSNLNSKISSNIFTEVQEIILGSTVVYESYVN